MLLSDKQIAERIGIHRVTVWNWARCEPTFPKPLRVGPQVTRWRAEDIDAWLASRPAR